MWSMGDLFHEWLTPPDGPLPYVIGGNHFEVFGYALPDEGRLSRHLVGSAKQHQFESSCFVSRLHEAVEAWESLVTNAVVVVLRECRGVLVTDKEVMASLATVPDWRTDIDRANTG